MASQNVPVGLEHAMHGRDPARATSRDSRWRSLLVVVDVVVVADVERRIGEGQIDAARGQRVHALDAVAVADDVELGVGFHAAILLGGGSGLRCQASGFSRERQQGPQCRSAR